jgi:hypothetical protein
MGASEVVVLVHFKADHANAWQQALGHAGYSAIIAKNLVEAIDVTRRHTVAALVCVGPRKNLTTAASHLESGEQFPPCVIISDDRDAIGIRARGVMTLLDHYDAYEIIPCLRTLLACAGPSSENRTLPMRMTRMESGKFSSWLVPPPGRPRHDSDWR